MDKRKKDKQQSTKHYTENKKSSNTKKLKIEQHEAHYNVWLSNTSQIVINIQND